MPSVALFNQIIHSHLRLYSNVTLFKDYAERRLGLIDHMLAYSSQSLFTILFIGAFEEVYVQHHF